MIPAYIMLTALLAQLIYILINWYFFKRKEYFFYSLYILSVTCYFLNKYLADGMGIVHLGSLHYLKLYPDKTLALVSYLFYFKFGRHFVETKTRYPSIDKMMKYTEKIVLGYIILNVFMLLAFGRLDWENYSFVPVNLGIFMTLVIVFRAMIKKKEMLDRFILIGSLSYAVCAFITMWIGQFHDPLYDGHIKFLQIGALIELLLLNAGLVYKSRMIQKQVLQANQQLIDRYRENQQLIVRLSGIREKISRDLHDDLGATLSSIKIYSELLESKENNTITEQIRHNASDIIDRLEMIAWSTNPTYDHFKSLFSHMQSYAAPLCHSVGIELNFELTTIPEDLKIPGETRQNIFTVFKEGINNIMKYSAADKCSVSLSISKDRFLMNISDDGKGFDIITVKKGHGLDNMQKRTKELFGSCQIQSAPGKGTFILFDIPYPFQFATNIEA